MWARYPRAVQKSGDKLRSAASGPPPGEAPTPDPPPGGAAPPTRRSVHRATVDGHRAPSHSTTGRRPHRATPRSAAQHSTSTPTGGRRRRCSPSVLLEGFCRVGPNVPRTGRGEPDGTQPWASSTCRIDGRLALTSSIQPGPLSPRMPSNPTVDRVGTVGSRQRCGLRVKRLQHRLNPHHLFRRAVADRVRATEPLHPGTTRRMTSPAGSGADDVATFGHAFRSTLRTVTPSPISGCQASPRRHRHRTPTCIPPLGVSTQ